MDKIRRDLDKLASRITKIEIASAGKTLEKVEAAITKAFDRVNANQNNKISESKKRKNWSRLSS